jgi:HTH-type transcriptional regulator/antitoxin HigA
MADEAAMRYQPETISHPGEVLLDYLESNGWSQRDLARRSGLTPKTISEICNGKAPITPPTALAFEKVFGRPAHLWLNLQRQYDESAARRRVSAKLPFWESWAKRFPFEQMKRCKLIEPEGDNAADSLLKFFGVSSPDSWESVWNASNVAYRQTRKFHTTIEAISAWTRAAELQAAEIETNDFDDKRLVSVLDDLRGHTRVPVNEAGPAVEALCDTAGVAVVWVPELTKTGISGCARWLSDRKAMVALTLRYKTDDQIWFTFFHEIAHILLHRKQHSFILDNAETDLSDAIVDPQMQRNEEEANRFAADTLIPPQTLVEFIRGGSFTSDSINQFADSLSIAPGIVVGRLQREKLLAPHQGNRLKRRFEWNFDREESGESRSR